MSAPSRARVAEQAPLQCVAAQAGSPQSPPSRDTHVSPLSWSSSALCRDWSAASSSESASRVGARRVDSTEMAASPGVAAISKLRSKDDVSSSYESSVELT